jgi:hypothetical protein
MSNYTIAVNWSGKDALSDSDAAKVISGTDFNTEFSAVQTAVNTKANLNGSSSEAFAINNLTVSGTATIVGEATGPTPTTGDNTTKLATTAFVTTAAAAVVAGITTYTLPAATSSALGGVKASLSGTTLTISTT